MRHLGLVDMVVVSEVVSEAEGFVAGEEVSAVIDLVLVGELDTKVAAMDSVASLHQMPPPVRVVGAAEASGEARTAVEGADLIAAQPAATGSLFDLETPTRTVTAATTATATATEIVTARTAMEIATGIASVIVTDMVAERIMAASDTVRMTATTTLAPEDDTDRSLSFIVASASQLLSASGYP